MKRFDYSEIEGHFNVADYQDLIKLRADFLLDAEEKNYPMSYRNYVSYLNAVYKDQVTDKNGNIKLATDKHAVNRILRLNFTARYIESAVKPTNIINATIQLTLEDVETFYRYSGIVKHLNSQLDKEDIKILVLNDLGDKRTTEETKLLHDLMDSKLKQEEQQEIIISNVFPVVNEKGRPLKDYRNIEHVMKLKNIDVRYNVISKQNESISTKRVKMDDLVLDIHAHLNDLGANINDLNFIGLSVNRVASRNKYNPVADYLTECKKKYDGSGKYIQMLCDTLIENEDSNKQLKELLIKKWLLNTVKVAFNTGDFATQGVLVLQGAQGLGKTRWASKLVPSHLNNCFKEGMNLDVGNKDSIRENTKQWITEWGELDSTVKREQDKLKAFITNTSDVYRIPYGKDSENHERTTSFIGTVNDQQFLKDKTGSRRWWIVSLDRIDHDLMDMIDMDQLWGEVMNITDVPHYLTTEEMQLLSESNKDHTIESKLEILINTSFAWNAPKEYWKPTSQSYIAKQLNLYDTKGLKEIFESKGSKKKRARCKYLENDNPVACYMLPPFISSME